MKKSLFFVLAFAVVAVGLWATLPGLANRSAAAAQSAAAPAGQEPSQPKPYTADFFGPWNAAVAKTHVPQVTFEKAGKGLKVTVQVDNHPMDPQKPHWIMWVRLEDMKGKKLGEKTFKATDPRPAIAVFELPTMPSKLRALERCNIHGIWLNEASITVK